MSHLFQTPSFQEKYRPKNWEDFVGQEHLLSENSALRVLIEKDQITSLVFYGPSGTGKTSLARLISQKTQADFIEINATDSSVKEMREIAKKAEQNCRKTILFIDEVHRFNKAQQDVLLPYIEKRVLLFIGATTFNPFFYLTPALQSRTLIFEFKKIMEKDLIKLLDKISQDYAIQWEENAKEQLVGLCGGDARSLINRLEIVVALGEKKITQERLKEIFNLASLTYERKDDHYDVISAFIKSVRGSDPDAALYYLAIMIESGEDPRFICRRLAILAAEDIGLAEPGALAVIAGGSELVEKIGLPEARIILAEMTLYLTLLPKSNSAYLAIERALEYVKKNPRFEVPSHLKDAHYQGAKTLGRGIGYLYPHDYPHHYVAQSYWLGKENFYIPATTGREKNLNDYWERIKSLP